MREPALTLALFVMVGILGGDIRADRGQDWPNESAEVARLRARAERGEAEAQYRLGLALVRSTNVKMDVAQGLAWIQKAAVQQHPDAQYELGQMYQRGQGVPRDEAQAHAWYLRAAQQGHAGAQNDVGVDYSRGWGVPRDDTQAVEWFRRAVEQGYPLALHNLARSCFDGRGVPRDIVEAYKWQTLAIARGNAYQRLAMLETSRQIDQEITPTQVAEAKQRAREWTEAFERRLKKQAAGPASGQRDSAPLAAKTEIRGRLA